MPVKFWRQADRDDVRNGYTLNVSAGGMFIAAYRPLPPNALIEIEIVQPDTVVRTTARVVHAARYPAEFQIVMRSGMGVLFLDPDDPAIKQLSGEGQLLADRGGRRRFPRY
jgi:hypothetical protein